MLQQNLMEQMMSYQYQDENNDDDQSGQQSGGGLGALLLTMMMWPGGGREPKVEAGKRSPDRKSGYFRMQSPQPPSISTPVAPMERGWRDYPDVAIPYNVPAGSDAWAVAANDGSALQGMGLTGGYTERGRYAEIPHGGNRHRTPVQPAPFNAGEGAVPEMRRQLAHMGDVLDDAIEMEARRRLLLEPAGGAMNPGGSLRGVGGDRVGGRVRTRAAASPARRRLSMSSLPKDSDKYGETIRPGIVERGIEIFDI